MSELLADTAEQGGAAELLQRPQDARAADDPEHVEPPEGVEGHEALGRRRGRCR